MRRDSSALPLAICVDPVAMESGAWRTRPTTRLSASATGP
jgi:hypothetical protein